MLPVPVLLDHITPIKPITVADLVTVVSEDSGQVLISGRSSLSHMVGFGSSLRSSIGTPNALGSMSPKTVPAPAP
ncbi:MAG: hypothetical protein FWD57_16160 [Polyangiaceae bacterium]|nr:hypothetical protein [Polyangiaceae bacterium]